MKYGRYKRWGEKKKKEKKRKKKPTITARVGDERRDREGQRGTESHVNHIAGSTNETGTRTCTDTQIAAATMVVVGRSTSLESARTDVVHRRAWLGVRMILGCSRSGRRERQMVLAGGHIRTGRVQRGGIDGSIEIARVVQTRVGKHGRVRSRRKHSSNLGRAYRRRYCSCRPVWQEPRSVK